MRLLIIGDSFSSSNTSVSWTQLLGAYVIENLSTNGSSEYRILKKLQKANLSNYDQIIIVHTSPNRIYINSNPLHKASTTHQDCDLIYQDVHARPTEEFAEHATWWFENIFDIDHAADMHHMLVEKIQSILINIPSLHLTFFDLHLPGVTNLHNIWETCPGDVNHLSKKGNEQVAEFVRNNL